MRISSCEHPKIVYSKATDSFIRVACGKCATCCDNKAKKWIDRLDRESQLHRYTFMVTLTYSDDYLPSYFFSEDMEYLESNREELLRIPLHELVELCKDEYGEYLEDDLDYLRSRLMHPLGLPVVCSSDLSKFFKRFNKYCFKHITNKYENFRYFATWEYGPTTYRPHVHLLMWFDDKRISESFTEILHKTWSFGDSDGSSVFSHGGRSYVAQYVNRPTHLPAFYAHSAFRQRSQFSRSPSLGSMQSLVEALPKIYYELPIKRTVWDSQAAKYDVVSIDDEVKYRFFPKCPQYSERPYLERVVLYGAVEIIPAETFRDFRFSLASIDWATYRNIASSDERILVSYYRKVKADAKDEKSLTSTLYRWYRISKNIVWFSRVLHVTLNDYVSRIDEFWKLIDYDLLKQQFQFQVDYVNNLHSLSDLIWMYPEFAFYVQNIYSDPCIMPKWVRYALSSFNINDYADFPKLRDTFDYRSMSELHTRIYRDSHKRMHTNAYRDGKLEQRDTQLAHIVRKYQKFKNIYE